MLWMWSPYRNAAARFYRRKRCVGGRRIARHAGCRSCIAGRCALQSSEDLAASQYPLKLSDKLVEMVLDNAVQIDKLSVDVVEYLYFGRLRP